MRKAYIISSTNKLSNSTKISQEGYSSLKKAQEFLEHRTGNPQKVTEWHFENRFYSYQILEISIK